MRLDTFAEKFIASVDRRVIRQFGNASSLLIVSVTTACVFTAVLFWTTEQDAQVEVELVAASQRVPYYFLEESTVDEPLEGAVFTYAVLGSSECTYLLAEGIAPGLSPELSRELANQKQFRVTSHDFCDSAVTLEEKYRGVVVASLLNVDLIVVTHTAFQTLSLFGTEKGPQFSDIEDSGDAIIFAYATPPMVAMERFLSDKFPSFGNRFEHSLAPIFAPERFQLVGRNLNPPLSRTLPVRQARIALHDPKVYESIDSRIVSKLQKNNPGHPGEAFELIARPAIERNIPLIFVITPLNQNAAPMSYKFSKDPVLRNAAIDSENRIAKNFAEAEEYIEKKYSNVRLWLAYQEELFSPSDFFDLSHLLNFKPLAKRLVEVLDEEGFLPDE